MAVTARRGSIPHPPHPRNRREPLPWRKPKPARDDARAPGKLKAIVSSPTFREAEHDADFLQRDDNRGVRLLLEYSKAESILDQHGIRHTILVLGSTRFQEPAAAQRRVDELRRALKNRPGN